MGSPVQESYFLLIAHAHSAMANETQKDLQKTTKRRLQTGYFSETRTPTVHSRQMVKHTNNTAKNAYTQI